MGLIVIQAVMTLKRLTSSSGIVSVSVTSSSNENNNPQKLNRHTLFNAKCVSFNEVDNRNKNNNNTINKITATVPVGTGVVCCVYLVYLLASSRSSVRFHPFH